MTLRAGLLFAQLDADGRERGQLCSIATTSYSWG